MWPGQEEVCAVPNDLGLHVEEGSRPLGWREAPAGEVEVAAVHQILDRASRVFHSPSSRHWEYGGGRRQTGSDCAKGALSAVSWVSVVQSIVG